MRIEICGGVASGKTTLCKLIATSGYRSILENFHHNPFWSEFYREPKVFAFETEITFLLQHYSQTKIAASKSDRAVCDFAFLQDDAYAGINLKGAQLAVFRAVYGQVLDEISSPTFMIHLVCPAEEQLVRIRRRARPEESFIELDYLEKLNRTIANCAVQFRARAPILSIDSAANDFANDLAAQERVLISIISAMTGDETTGGL